MAKAKRGRKAPPKRPSVFVWGGASLAALFIFLSLISYSPADPSAFGGAAAVRNWFGPAGAAAAALLAKTFGLLAFWPVPALLAVAWIDLRKIPRGQKTLIKAAGAVLLLFSISALLSLPGPDFKIGPFPGGGRFGLFLAAGATAFLGRVGA